MIVGESTGFGTWRQFPSALLEATLHRARRLADREPPHAFARTIELAVREVRVAAARYWSRDVETWKAEVLRELGARIRLCGACTIRAAQLRDGLDEVNLVGVLSRGRRV